MCRGCFVLSLLLRLTGPHSADSLRLPRPVWFGGSFAHRLPAMWSDHPRTRDHSSEQARDRISLTHSRTGWCLRLAKLHRIWCGCGSALRRPGGSWRELLLLHGAARWRATADPTTPPFSAIEGQREAQDGRRSQDATLEVKDGRATVRGPCGARGLAPAYTAFWLMLAHHHAF